jgi:hypothetical protein
MKFDTMQELSNHSKKVMAEISVWQFCITSDYGTVGRLEQKFANVEKAKAHTDQNVNMGAVRGCRNVDR